MLQRRQPDLPSLQMAGDRNHNFPAVALIFLARDSGSDKVQAGPQPYHAVTHLGITGREGTHPVCVDTCTAAIKGAQSVLASSLPPTSPKHSTKGLPDTFTHGQPGLMG